MAEYIDKLSVYKEACVGCTCHGDEIGSCFSSEPCERLCFAFASAHAVDVSPVVHGRWEWASEDIYRCTACNEKAHVAEVMGRPAWGHCPNCGAKMDGGDDNEAD